MKQALSARCFRLGLLALAWGAGCATAGLEAGREARLEIARLTPPEGAHIDADTQIEVVFDIEVANVRPRLDRLRALFKTHDGGTWEYVGWALDERGGPFTIRLHMKRILAEPSLLRPLRVVFVIDREAAGDDGNFTMRRLAATREVQFNADAAPAPVETAAAKLPPSVGAGLLISDVHRDAAARPQLPRDLSGTVVWGLFKICVDRDGAVSTVDTLKSPGPLVDSMWKETIRRWRYRPFTIDDRKVPFCYPMRIELRP